MHARRHAEHRLSRATMELLLPVPLSSFIFLKGLAQVVMESFSFPRSGVEKISTFEGSQGGQAYLLP